MRKRGSQVGFVLSFVIFVIFIFFLFIIVKPSLKTSNSNNLPQNIIGRIADAASANLTTISVSFDKSNPQGCFQMKNFFANSGAENNLTAADENGGTPSLEISSSGNNLYITKNASASFVKIYGSDEFAALPKGTLSGCQLIDENGTGYTLGLIKTDKEIFASKIIALMINYTEDYDTLKSYLGIPDSNDFGFSFLYNNGTLLSAQKPVANVNVYAYEIPVQYITQRGKIESGFLNVRTW